MPVRPGKYDPEAQEVQQKLQAAGVFLIVGGQKGSGFSVVATAEVLALAPALLRDMADEIEKSAR